MMKIVLYFVLVNFSVAIIGMEQEKQEKLNRKEEISSEQKLKWESSYLELLPKELKELLTIFMIQLKDTKQKLKRKSSYLELLPKELKGLLTTFMIQLKGTKDFNEVLERLKAIEKIKQFVTLFNTPAFNQLFALPAQIKQAIDFSDALKKVKEVAEHKQLSFLFDDPYFTYLVIKKLQRKTPVMPLSEISKDLEDLQ